MPSPICEVQVGAGAFQSTTFGVDLSPGAAFKIRLASQADVRSWLIQCITTDDLSDAAAVNAGLTIDPVAKTASGVAPVAGRALRFLSVVNGGIDLNGRPQPSYRTTFGLYTLIDGRSVIAADETIERDPVFGYIRSINTCIRAIADLVVSEVPFPSSIPNLLARYRPDLGGTVAGGTLSALADQSGSGDANKNLASAGAAQPVYTASDSQYGGKPTLTFAGTSRLEGAIWAASQAQPTTIYVVGHDSVANGRLVDGYGSIRQVITNNSGKLSIYSGTAFIDAVGSTPGNPGLLCAVFNGASSAFHINDPVTPNVSGNPGASVLGRITLGAFTGGGGELTGKIAEVAAFAGAHDVNQRTAMFDYFARYGL